MAQNTSGSLLLCVLCFCLTQVLVSSHSRKFSVPNVTRLTDYFSHLDVDQGFTKLYGASNIQVINNGSMAKLGLNKFSGSGLLSKNKYNSGFFSAAIKLPSGFSSGVVVAFYLSNGETYPHNHDEIDIELLGRSKRDDWVVQTNIYANGSVSTGREEKFYFWFDPTESHHYYTIIWNPHHVLFLIDNIPVRQFPNSGAFTSVYPSKPMSLYITIWDGSQWATHGGKYPVNYKFAPFIASFADMEISGCTYNSNSPVKSASCSKSGGSISSLDPIEGQDFARLSKQQISAMDWARRKLMFYSYCKDVTRYKVMPPECK